MKTLILLSSLLFSAHAFSSESVAPTKQIEISEEKGTDQFNYYFGTVRVNSRYFVNYRITNTGTTPLTYQYGQIRGDAAYRASTNCNTVLAPGQRCSFTIEYAPYFQGSSSALFEMAFVEGYSVRVYVSGFARPY